MSILLIRDIVVIRWNRIFGFETIHLTRNFISMNLFQISCVIQGHDHFLPSSLSACSAYQIFTKKFLSVMTLSLRSASISRILEPSPQGLISSLFLSRLLLPVCLLGSSE